MRIVYDYSGHASPPPARASPASGARREDVLVVRVGSGAGRGGRGENGLGRADAANAAGAAGGEAGSSAQARYRTTDEARARDREVRGHENAHLSALGPYAASGILYDTARGADGEAIAVGGRIAVDLAEVPGDPEATIRKARTVLNAAAAPGDPSAADMRVAARAYRLMQEARSELSVERFA